MSLDTRNAARPHPGQPVRPAQSVQPVHPVPPVRRVAAVVAGLVNDGSALGVARVALAEAVERGGRIRFVQVVPPGLGADERADADEGTFHAAMVALRAHPRVRSSFEVVVGDVAQTLVEHSREAGVLIVGQDDPGAATRVADYCREHADCEVRVVS
jgi:nucleotide-binding universal stress UspA family protein